MGVVTCLALHGVLS